MQRIHHPGYSSGRTGCLVIDVMVWSTPIFRMILVKRRHRFEPGANIFNFKLGHKGWLRDLSPRKRGSFKLHIGLIMGSPPHSHNFPAKAGISYRHYGAQ